MAADNHGHVADCVDVVPVVVDSDQRSDTVGMECVPTDPRPIKPCFTRVTRIQHLLHNRPLYPTLMKPVCKHRMSWSHIGYDIFVANNICLNELVRVVASRQLDKITQLSEDSERFIQQRAQFKRDEDYYLAELNREKNEFYSLCDQVTEAKRQRMVFQEQVVELSTRLDQSDAAHRKLRVAHGVQQEQYESAIRCLKEQVSISNGKVEQLQGELHSTTHELETTKQKLEEVKTRLTALCDHHEQRERTANDMIAALKGESEYSRQSVLMLQEQLDFVKRREKAVTIQVMREHQEEHIQQSFINELMALQVDSKDNTADAIRASVSRYEIERASLKTDTFEDAFQILLDEYAEMVMEKGV